MAKPRIAEFDGLRGAAILIVVLGHYCSSIFPGLYFFNYAAVGVDIFFVLSGFLIGGAILDGAGEEGFLARFFRRRSARILPLYFLVLALAFLAQGMVAGAPWADRLFPAWTYATFTMNIWSAWHVQEPAPLLSPTWSLSVEELFYFLAPFLLPLATRKRLPAWIGLLCFAAILFRYFFRFDIYAMELMLPARMDSLLIGVGVAYIHRNVDLTRYRDSLGAVVLAIPLIYVPLMLDFHGKQFLLAHTAFAFITAAYMLLVLGAPGSRSIFRAPWLGGLAKISFGVYLIHQPVDVLLTGILLGKSVYASGLDRISVTMLSLGLTIVLAMLSRRFFENPILRWERRTAAPPPAMRSVSYDGNAAPAACLAEAGP